MNERIKELAIQVGLACESGYGLYPLNNDLNRLERFADLIRQDEREQISHTYLKLTLEAVLREREACAKVCESMGVHPTLNVHNGGPEWYQRQKECAAAIRARGDKHD